MTDEERGRIAELAAARLPVAGDDGEFACEPERRIELLTYALRVRCSAV